jgi:oxalate decarboxylase/phosphoglucose isomerase-like protein (cupin superfamily)
MSTTATAERMVIGGDELTIRARSDDTGGAILAVEVRMPAGGGPPMLHRHEAAEVYRVESGELTVYLEDEDGVVRRGRATPGSVVPIPGGRAHTVRNESAAEMRASVVFSPGDAMERFVRAAGELAAAGAPAMRDVLDLAARHGVEMAGPVPDLT